MLLATLLLIAGGAAAQSPAPSPPVPQEHASPPRRAAAAANRTDKNAAEKSAHPDAALIEYLGEFDDAADGLDAMGLEESAGSDVKPGGGAR